MKTPKESNLKPPWKKGQSGNPAGRPKGARDKLSRDFIKAMRKDFKENGVAAIERMRDEKPEAYIAAIGKLVPKEERVEHTGEGGGPVQVTTTVKVVHVNDTE